MISEECARVGNVNRKRWDAGLRDPNGFLHFPLNCECACGHELPAEWEKMFRVPQPGKE